MATDILSLALRDAFSTNPSLSINTAVQEVDSRLVVTALGGDVSDNQVKPAV